jgi:hypothetical protein
MKVTTEMCRAHLNYISKFLFHYDFNSKYTHNFQNLNASLIGYPKTANVAYAGRKSYAQ